ncbi:MAG: hypothetical protein GF331_08730 [Chitinivibrionales bacterium]|nr:hypothetical protein [Chitinivibrionales bacterium]
MGKKRSRVILDETSLATTLWRLESARLDGITRRSAAVSEALAWIQSRIGQEGAYAPMLAAPTPQDLSQGTRLTLMTGERAGYKTRHTLGEEAFRALHLWLGQSDEKLRTELWPRSRSKKRPGYWCCPLCTLAFGRGLLASRPDGWEIRVQGIADELTRADTAPDGTWWRFPFYYALLTLSDAPAEMTREVRKKVRGAAKKRMVDLGDDPDVARFREIGLRWAIG